MSDVLLSADIAPGLAAMAGLTLASAFFSASETALFYLSHDEQRNFRAGNVRQRTAAALLADPDRLLTAVLFWNLVVNLTYFAVSVVLTQRLTRHGAGAAAAGTFGLVSVLALIVCGEVLPKSIAVVFSRRLAPLVSLPLAVAVRALDPVTAALRQLTRVARRTFWPHVARETYISAEDLERAVEASELSTDVIRQERQVLHTLLDLSEMTVEEVMRPRGTYLALAPPVHLPHLKGEVPPGDFVAIGPAGTDDVDAVIPLADFPALPAEHLESRAESVLHVPWCANVAQTMQALRDRFCPAASVLNEYGETIGLVLFDDLIDTLFAPEASRGRRLLRREPILQIDAGAWHVDGITTLRYLCRRLQLPYEQDAETLLTVAGLLHAELEHLPEVGDEITWRGHRIRVIEVTEQGRPRVMVSRLEDHPAPASHEGPQE